MSGQNIFYTLLVLLVLLLTYGGMASSAVDTTKPDLTTSKYQVLQL